VRLPRLLPSRLSFGGDGGQLPLFAARELNGVLDSLRGSFCTSTASIVTTACIRRRRRRGRRTERRIRQEGLFAGDPSTGAANNGTYGGMSRSRRIKQRRAASTFYALILVMSTKPCSKSIVIILIAMMVEMVIRVSEPSAQQESAQGPSGGLRESFNCVSKDAATFFPVARDDA
jgi:hypothetical protein